MKRAAAFVAVLLAVGVVAWLGVLHRKPPAAALLPYQGWVGELPRAARRRFAEVRSALRLAEQHRGKTQQWPAQFVNDRELAWSLSIHGPYVNYLGIPSDPAGLRWLVLIIEPEPAAIRDPAPPEDEEHQTLSDGTGLHVTVWTSPNTGSLPLAVLAFPAAEGWTQRLSDP